MHNIFVALLLIVSVKAVTSLGILTSLRELLLDGLFQLTDDVSRLGRLDHGAAGHDHVGPGLKHPSRYWRYDTHTMTGNSTTVRECL